MTSTPLGKFTSLGTLALAGGAEISAYHAGAKLLFTIGGSSTLSVVDLSNPATPLLLTILTLDGVGNSVAVSSTGLVAVAVEGAGTARYTDGKVAFFKVAGVGSAATVSAAGSVAVGIVPDSVAFTPDGKKLVVANEGEANELYTVDPEGSVSVISIDGTTTGNSTVQTVSFKGLNGRDAELAALGIRLGGKSGSTVAQHLEPEYVAISADGKKAYVTFQENNALGVIKLDGATPTLESLRSVGVQDYVRGQASIQTYNVPIASPGTTTAGAVVPGGGLSGLYATGKDSEGRLTFLTPADRGANGTGTTKDVLKPDGSAGTDGIADPVQPFLLPDYQGRFYKLALNETTGVVTVTGEVKLTRKDGTTPITGRSNGKGDQIPVDANGNLLNFDPYGADLESIVQDKDGNIWMSDEYRPAIYKFDATGKLIERYVPVGAGVAAGLGAGALGAETLPAEYAKRQTNRGFEGLAYDAIKGKLFGFLQSPLDDVGANDGTKGSLVRILEVEATTGAPTGEYLYAMAGKGSTSAAADSPFYESKVDKIGDVAYDAARQVFYVLERDSTAGALSYKQVFEVSLKGATNILGNAVANEENLSIDALKLQGITTASKVLLTNLSSEGYLPNDKPEGLALLADGRLAVINDNDFGVTPLDAAAYSALSTAEKAKYSLASDIGGSHTYVYANGADAKTQLGIVSFTPTGIDPSDKDKVIALLNKQNIYGLRQPDGVAAFQTIGRDGSIQTFTVIANEGDTRVRPDGDYVLDGIKTVDASVFADELRSGVTGTGNDNRLKIITDLGNYDPTTAAYEQKFIFGGRSISILDSLGNVIWDSGDAIDRAAIAAGTYDDNRSDDKGSEPENVTVATIDGRIYAFVALERSGGVASFDVTDPYNASFGAYNKSAPGVVSPEGILIISADKSPNGRTLMVTSNEVSKQLEVLAQDYRLQLLHLSDGEAGLLASQTAPYLAALVDGFDDTYANTLILAGGDNYIAGPFLNGGTDLSVRGVLNAVTGSTISLAASTNHPIGAVDIAIHNLIGVEASTIGNHELDLGPRIFKDSFTKASGWVGAQFPYLSANLEFSGDADLKGSFTDTPTTAGLEEASALKGKIVPSAVVTKNGERIGLVGATTQILEKISSTGGVEVKGFTGDGSEVDDMVLLASQLQPVIDDLISQGVNKVILMAHLQQIANEKALAPLLRGVDIILSAGSNTRLGDSNDQAVAFPGHAANFADTYPLLTQGADGAPTLIVNTDNEYTYLGRLVVDFDAQGRIIPGSVDPLVSGAYAATAANVAKAWNVTEAQLATTAFAEGTKAENVQDLTDAVQSVIGSKDGQVWGFSNVYLEGERAFVRSEETNLGDLTADANLFYAKGIDPSVVISLKNGGGIRSQIGSVDVVSGAKETTLANPLANKPEGGVSTLDIENSLRFNNSLSLVTVSASKLKELLEHGIALHPNQGRFPQVSGLAFSFDLTKPAGSRIVNLAIQDSQGNDLDVVVREGVLVGDSTRTFRMVTLNFLAGAPGATTSGGDGYPFPLDAVQNIPGGLSNRVDLFNPTAQVTGAAKFSGDGTEQDALAEYLKANYGTQAQAYNQADTSASQDQRLQNLALRSDAVIDPVRFGTAGNDSNVALPGQSTIPGFDGRLDTVFTGAGDDEVDISITGGRDNKIFTGSGADVIYAGIRDVITGGSGDDTIYAEVGDSNRLSGNTGNDSFYIGTAGNRCLGGEGDDIFNILETAGTNYLNGGAGRDQFWLMPAKDKLPAKQFVMDFTAGDDKVVLRGSTFAALSFTDVAGATLLKVDGVEVAQFMNVGSSLLNSLTNFVFV